jgi:hypothetical protein
MAAGYPRTSRPAPGSGTQLSAEGRDSQPKSGPRKIACNLSLDFATFTWTGHDRINQQGLIGNQNLINNF